MTEISNTNLSNTIKQVKETTSPKKQESPDNLQISFDQSDLSLPKHHNPHLHSMEKTP